MSYNPKAQIVSSLDAAGRKYRLDPSQYHQETEGIIRLCKSRGIRLAALRETGALEEAYLPNRFSRAYSKNPALGVPMIGTSSMLNLRLPQDMRVFLRNIRNPERLYIREGDLLVSRSGTVGACVLCGKSYESFIASDDCIRLRLAPDWRGYAAAYLKSPYGQALMTRDAHGKVIRHLKPEDLTHLPIMVFAPEETASINAGMLEASSLYDKSRALLSQIDVLLTAHLGHLLPETDLEEGCCMLLPSPALRLGRLDPHFYERRSQRLFTAALRREGTVLGEIASVWTVPRFKRSYLSPDNPYAAPLYSSADIVRANFSPSKYVSQTLNARNLALCRVKAGDVLVPCSGTYGGILGRGVLAGELLEGKALSQHVLRMRKQPAVPQAAYDYAAAFLCSGRFGYPLLTATRFGKDIPELDLAAVKAIPIPSLPEETQARIGAMLRESCALQEAANRLENSAVEKIAYLYEQNAK